VLRREGVILHWRRLLLHWRRKEEDDLEQRKWA
jgi:hypothetical protein